jgi:GT2 family glycosyltransferase
MNSSLPLFSVIIPTRNRRDLLRECLTAVTRQEYPHVEIIVIDDGSSDGTDQMVRTSFPCVRYIHTRSGAGSPAARNCGVYAARGDIIAFTDDDCVPPRDWLTRHLLHHRSHTGIGAVGGFQLPLVPNFYDMVQQAHDAEKLSRIAFITEISAWEGLATNNMSVPRHTFEEVGYFDERFLTGSDPEFTRRVCRAGYMLIQDPDLRVAHLKKHTLRSYLLTRFHRACGSIFTDIKEGSLSLRRFMPLPNVVRLYKEWARFRRITGGGANHFARYWCLAIVARWIEVAGRLYYLRRARRLRSLRTVSLD